jgi:parvulin-like peptidyl-prolyl isomerase
VAEVDGKPIPAETLAEAVGPAADGVSLEEREASLLRELERLLREQVVLNRGEELGMEVTDEEVDAFLRRLLGEERDPVDPSFREEVRREMLIDRTSVLELAPQLDIPQSAVAVHFAEHRSRYQVPPRAEARHIVVASAEKAGLILEELRAGADFEELARTTSLGPEAKSGGLLPPFQRGELPEAFDKAFELMPGKVSAVIQSPFGYHIFQLVREIPAHEPTLEEVSEEIRSELRETRFVSLRDEWLKELRRKARIRINEPVLESLR